MASTIRNVGKLVGLLIFLACPSISLALPEDKSKLLQVKADFADINQETHNGSYNRHVELDQGSTHLRADNAQTKANQKNKLILAIANGNKNEQAHFWTLTDINKPPLHAYANIIRYFPNKHLIELEGNARVEQGKDSFSAPKISYDTLHKHVVSNAQGLAQTIIIIHPEKKHE